MGRNKTAVFRTLKGAGIFLLFLLVLASFSVYMAPNFGWRVDGLRSGSMAPQLNTGDMVVTRPVAPEVVTVGDIIVFHSVDKRDYLLSHRVVGIEKNSLLSFRTRGDANEAADPFVVPSENLVGRLAFHVPLLGYGVLFLRTTSGLLLFLVIPGACITAWCLKSLGYEVKTKVKKSI